MHLPVAMEIIKGTLRLVDPEALRSGYTVCDPSGEIGAGVPPLLVSLPPLQSGLCRNSTWEWGSKGAPHTPASLDSLWKPGEVSSDKSTCVFLAGLGP